MNPHRTCRRAVRPADGLALITSTPPAQGDLHARRGDLALIVTVYRDPATTAVAGTEIELAEITSVTRDGRITTVRLALSGAVTALSGRNGLSEVFLLPRTRISVPAALKAAHTHTRDGQPAPYPDLDTACTAVRPHLIPAGNSGVLDQQPTNREAPEGTIGAADPNVAPEPGRHCRHTGVCPPHTSGYSLPETATLILAELITISDGGPGTVLPTRIRFAAEVYPQAKVICIQVFGLRDTELAHPHQRLGDGPSPTDIAEAIRAVARAANLCAPGKEQFEVRVFLPDEADQRQLSGFIGTVTTDSRPNLPTGA